jgi:hypothetical protein
MSCVVEPDYRQLRGALGLDDYEGRQKRIDIVVR